MNVKNVLVGLILVVFGVFIGYSLSSKVEAKQEQSCSKEKKCTKGHKGHKGHKAHRGGMTQERFCPEICEKLNLSDEQKAQVKELFAQKAEQKAECRKSKQVECEKFQEELNKILTAEQQAQFAEIKAECKAKRGDCSKAKKCDKKCCDAKCCECCECCDDADCCKKCEKGECKANCSKPCAKGEAKPCCKKRTKRMY